MKILSINYSLSFIFLLQSTSCASVNPKVSSQIVTKTGDSKKIPQKDSKTKKSNSLKLKNWKNVDLDKLESDFFSSDQNEPLKEQPKKSVVFDAIQPKKIENRLFYSKGIENPKNKNGYSNSIRIKTVYELATETKPILFTPHDEFETADEYKNRVTQQVRLMKEIVQMTSQKMDIKNAQRNQIAEEKELKKISLLQRLMAESSSSVEFTPNDIGRYNPEQETFPVVLHNVQYQISVPREEARTFKENFKSIKIKGLKQLKAKYDVSITASKAHIRSRPNGSIIGIVSLGDVFEHVQDEDEWHKINFKGQFGFTHQNNAELKLVDIANQYEYQDLVAIHPTTGSMFTMISVDELVKAPLNLASRKYSESVKTDGPK